jgi:hypothetical protein
MQFEIHGTGTALYGRRDFLLDRSFITTEWVTVGYVPIVPLISKRISYTRLDPFHTYDRSGHFIVAVLPLNLKQVVSVYTWVCLFFGSFIIFGCYREALVRKFGDEDMVAGPFLAFWGALIVLPYALRRFAIWRTARTLNRASFGLSPRSFD